MTTPVLANRPERTKHAIWKLVSYWRDRDPCPFLINTEIPHCFACQRIAPDRDTRKPVRDQWNAAGGWLERAHLVDRCFDGLDYPSNVVPLCWKCHKIMSSYRPDKWYLAIGWVRGGGQIFPLLNMPSVKVEVLSIIRFFSDDLELAAMKEAGLIPDDLELAEMKENGFIP